jgi:hypothetical protein
MDLTSEANFLSLLPRLAHRGLHSALLLPLLQDKGIQVDQAYQGLLQGMSVCIICYAFEIAPFFCYKCRSESLHDYKRREANWRMTRRSRSIWKLSLYVKNIPMYRKIQNASVLSMLVVLKIEIQFEYRKNFVSYSRILNYRSHFLCNLL